MTLATLTSFFGWCALFNIAFLTFWTVAVACAPNLVYRMQCGFFKIPRATFDVVIYSYLGMFKIVMVAFSIVPYLALLAIA